MTEELINNTSETAPETVRNIETITAEINAIRGYAQAVVLSAAVEIGRRLKEAKDLLPHGEWGAWLKEKVDFSQVTASRYMKLFEEYADRQGSLFGAEVNLSTLKNLSVSNALRLLAVPAEEREEFAAEHDVENLSAREMDRLIKERDEAIRARDEAEEAAGQAQEDRDEAKERARRAETDLQLAQKQIKELEARPIDVAVQEPDPAELQKRIDAAVADAMKEAKAAAAEEKKKLKDKLSAAEQAKKDLEAKAEQARKEAEDAGQALEKARAAGASPEEKERLEREIAELKKKVAMSGAAVVSFNIHFEQVQRDLGQLILALKKVEDESTAASLRAALRKVFEVYGEQVGNG